MHISEVLVISKNQDKALSTSQRASWLSNMDGADIANILTVSNSWGLCVLRIAFC